MVTIVGGVYNETCIHPEWNECMGSAGRAASILARLNAETKLISYADSLTTEIFQNKSALEGFAFEGIEIPYSVSFEYLHCLASPVIDIVREKRPPIEITAEKVLCFGMLEGEAIIDCDFAVYDPQNGTSSKHFHENGSRAKHLAIILNEHEANILVGESGLTEEALIFKLIEQTAAEVVVLKRGPRGALLYHDSAYISIPSFITERVWKMGSGDVFTSYFAHSWLVAGEAPKEAAYIASKATAYYCNTLMFPELNAINDFDQNPVVISDRVNSGYKPVVYLAGPFFTLSQVWMIEQARKDLFLLGIEVFSPLHDVGRGPASQVVSQDLEGIRDCDVVFAIGDGLDTGTIFEIGYARALHKPVVFYAESVTSENKKMLEGSACIMATDYTSAIYRTVWEAISS